MSPLPPSTLVRVTLQRSYRRNQTGRIESVFRKWAPGWTGEPPDGAALYWVRFADGMSGAFRAGEFEVIRQEKPR